MLIYVFVFYFKLDILTSAKENQFGFLSSLNQLWANFKVSLEYWMQRVHAMYQTLEAILFPCRVEHEDLTKSTLKYLTVCNCKYVSIIDLSFL